MLVPLSTQTMDGRHLPLVRPDDRYGSFVNPNSGRVSGELATGARGHGQGV